MRIFHYFFGWVGFQISGIYTERFLSYILQNRLPVYKIVPQKDGVHAVTTPRAYKKLRQPAKKYGVKLRHDSKGGFPLFFKKLWSRKGLCAGILLCIIFLYVLSGLVWQIDVVGNSTVSDDDILLALQQNGVHLGCYIKNLSLKSISKKLVVQCPQVARAAIHYSGSRVVVDIDERRVAQPGEEEIPANVVAAQNGKVVSITPRSGHAQVVAGDYVYKGQLLITGVYEDYWQKSHLVRAEGEVLAAVEQQISFYIPKQAQAAVVSNTKNGYGLLLLNRQFLLWGQPGEVQSSKDLLLNIYPFVFPIGFTVTTGYDVTYKKVELTADQAKDRAEKMAAFTAEKLQDATVTFQQITEENGVYYADYLFAFTTDIARQADIAVG